MILSEVLLLEDRVEFLAKQYRDKLIAAVVADRSPHLRVSDKQKLIGKKPEELPIELVKKLAEADPTGQRHDALGFIVKMYANQQFQLEDIERVLGELTKFNKFKNKLQPLPEIDRTDADGKRHVDRPALPNPKDLNSYKTMNQLYDVLKPFEGDNGDEEKSVRQREKEAKAEGADVVINGKDIKIIKLKTPEAAELYAAGTRWCTSSASTFCHYDKQDDIYVIMAKFPDGKTRKFQLHYSSAQMRDETDAWLNDKDKKVLSSFPEYTEFLNKMIEHYYINKYKKGQKK